MNEHDMREPCAEGVTPNTCGPLPAQVGSSTLLTAPCQGVTNITAMLLEHGTCMDR